MSALAMSALVMSALVGSALNVYDVLKPLARGGIDDRFDGEQLPLVASSTTCAFTFGLASEDVTNTSRAMLERGAMVTFSVSSGDTPWKSCTKEAVVLVVLAGSVRLSVS